MHAIGRRAVDITKTVGSRLHVHRRVQGQRIRFGTVVLLGRHDLDIGDGPERLVQGDDAGSLVTVVVANEDFHTVILRVTAATARTGFANPGITALPMMSQEQSVPFSYPFLPVPTRSHPFLSV